MKIILFIVSMICCLFCFAQKPASNGYYAKLNYGNGTHFLLGASLQHINKKGFSVTAQLVYESRDARNVPKDFKAGGFFGGAPFVSITTGSLLIGKVLEDKSRLVRFNLMAGINYGAIDRPVNFQRQSMGGGLLFYRDNYKYSWDKKWFTGLVLNPSIDFTLTRIIGLALGARANINYQDISVGFEVGLLLGYLRGKPPKN